MKVDGFRYDELITFSPGNGKLFFQEQRIIIMNAESFGELIREIADIGGMKMAKIFMRRFGEAAGRSDAMTIKEKLNPDTDMDWIALGPTIHSWEGIVRAEPEVIEFDRDTGEFYMRGIWENSFFAEQYLRVFGRSTESVCSMLTGYATGYASMFFGRSLVAKEPTCIAKGDDLCRFEIKSEEDWEKGE